MTLLRGTASSHHCLQNGVLQHFRSVICVHSNISRLIPPSLLLELASLQHHLERIWWVCRPEQWLLCGMEHRTR